MLSLTAEDSDLNEIDLAQACDGTYTISVGDKNVPAGTYAKQALYTVGCYTNESGTDGEITGPIKGKVTEADKVGSVCSYAQSGEVDPWLRVQLRCYALWQCEDRLHPSWLTRISQSFILLLY